MPENLSIHEVLNDALDRTIDSLSWAAEHSSRLSPAGKDTLSKWCEEIDAWITDLNRLVPADAVGQMLSGKELAARLGLHRAHLRRRYAPQALARKDGTDLFSPDDCLPAPENPPPQDSRPPQDRIAQQVNSPPVSVRSMSDVREKIALQTPFKQP